MIAPELDPPLLHRLIYLACSRLQDGGGKSFSNKKCEKRTGAGERQGFARFNTFPLYYLRAWYRHFVTMLLGEN